MRLLTLIAVSLLLSGCSFQSELFFQNPSTTTDAMITVTYKIPKTEFAREESKMDYTPQILTPKQYRSEKQKVPLTITHRSDSTLRILIPASSTARIASASNMAYMNKILEISYDGKHKPINQLIAASKKYRWDYVYLME